MDSWSDDEWFYESIKRYNSLLMFDFSSTVKFIELNCSDSICLAFEEKGEHNEISCLSLPRKMIVSKQYEGLEKDSDFRVRSGGFSQKPLVQLKALTGMNTIVTSEKDQQGVSVYGIPAENSGIIHRTATIPCEIESPNLAHNKDESLVVITTNKNGALLDTKELLIKGKIKPEETDCETNIQPEFVSSSSLGLCEAESGTTRIYDIRSEKTTNLLHIVSDHSSQNEKWFLSSSFLSTPHAADHSNETKLGLLSTAGMICIYDTRNTQHPLCSKEGEGICTTSIRKCIPKLQFSPSNSSLISVSGFNANIHLYEFSSESLKNVFVHDGHTRDSCHNDNITTDHVWYRDSVISACDNSSIHCWEYTK